jgi:hypothetical protein
MRSQNERPDVESVLSTLKDFQRRTVDHAFQRMYRDADNTRRFLIADEVGLGKTLVARGIIARAIDELWDTVERIDIVYICSNADIARQNINRLNVSSDRHFELASRVTLLPTKLHDLRQNKLNYVSFTPSTSFELKSRLGRLEERALLYWLLKKEWRFKGTSALNVLQGYADKGRFRDYVSGFSQTHRIDRDLQRKFCRALELHAQREKQAGTQDVRMRFKDLCAEFGYARKHIPQNERRRQVAVIGELRAILAATCMEALEPDLIILDEFQRFRHLLDEENDASQLARELFNYSDAVSDARVLLLSATPYKMYTLAQEGDGEDHYEDFLRTLRFLECNEEVALQYDQLLRDYRAELYRLGDSDAERLREIKSSLESKLRRVMARTERLAASTDRDGMLSEVEPDGVTLDADEIRRYTGLQQLADVIEHGDTIEYWKSAPYLLNFMEGYQFKRRVRKAAEDVAEEVKVGTALADAPGMLLPWSDVEEYQKIDPQNARIRWLLGETLERGMWRLLWLPPALPYYEAGVPFADLAKTDCTKRLIFSAWRVVPKVIATLLSYDAERRMISSFERSPSNTQEARDRRRPLLRFSISDGRLTGMPVLGLMYPSSTLARLLDPLDLSRPRENGRLPSIAQVMDDARERVKQQLQRLRPDSRGSGPEDETWYWAAPILLDLKSDAARTREWWQERKLAKLWGGELDQNVEEDKGWAAHVDEARQVASGARRLGRPPEDLVEVLAQLAIAGPGVTALRALCRVTGVAGFPDLAIRDYAADISWGFRSLFNLPESTALLRGMNAEEPYWRRVLEYCVAGNLQAVLDEYAHVLRDSLAVGHQPADTAAQQISEDMFDALTVRTTSLGVDEVSVDDSHRVSWQGRRMRARFGLRFGDAKAGTSDEGARSDVVRKAFNSPFWPFVLATTSVGQEGLDFHQYCHAVVHWNLPSNPVDLEQREGRVHRYKGHAVRKNVSRQYRSALADSNGDPWDRLFDAAVQGRPEEATDLVPFWVHSIAGGSQIERHVPALPLSRDKQRLQALRKSLAVYRMVFGQPRQEDLVAYLLEHLSADQIRAHLDELRVDLCPREVTE